MNESNIPRDLHLAGIQYSLDQNKANFDNNRKLSYLLDEIQEKWSREVYEVLGSKTNDYIIFREKAREIVRRMRPLFTATPEGRKIKITSRKWD
jgi:hypothetical protein